MEIRSRYFFIILLTVLSTSCAVNEQESKIILEKEIAEFHQKFASDQQCGEKSVYEYNREIYLEINKQAAIILKAFMELSPHLDNTDSLAGKKYITRLESIENPVILRAGFDQDKAESAYKEAIQSNDCELIKDNAAIFKQRIKTFGTARTNRIEYDTRIAKGIPAPPESCSFVGNYLDKEFSMCYENYQLPSQDFIMVCKARALISRASPSSIVYGIKCPSAIGACINSASLGVIEYRYEDKSKEALLKSTCEQFGGEWKSTP
jgi:hypothetical protein